MCAKKKVSFTLPWPPSVNKRLGHTRKNKRMFLTHYFKNYFADAKIAIIQQLKYKNKIITEKVNQILTFYPPDKRRRDNDNYTKAVNDGIKNAKVIEDDSLFEDTLIRWRQPVQEGCVKVKLGNFKFQAVYDDGTMEDL